MKDYLGSLNDRERWLVIGGGLILLIYLFYMFLYLPLNTKVNQNSALLTEKIATLNWMKDVQQKKPLTKKKESVDNSGLLNLISTQLNSNHALKFPYQLQQTSSGEVQLSFEEVPFNLFMTWLINLNDKYNLSIKQLETTQTKTVGVTKLMIILSAGS